jgi:replicative DNA helicase
MNSGGNEENEFNSPNLPNPSANEAFGSSINSGPNNDDDDEVPF